MSESDARLAEIRERLAAVTPGEWAYTAGVLKHYVSLGDDQHIGLQELHWRDGHQTRAEEDAQFIAHAPVDIAWLLAALEAARTPKPDTYACDKCGRRDGLDCVIPDQLWNQIAAETGYSVLCAWCLDAECAQRGWHVRGLLAFAGTAISAGTDPGNDDAHWEAHLGALTHRVFEAERRAEAAERERDVLRNACECVLRYLGSHQVYDKDAKGVLEKALDGYYPDGRKATE
jgi:hypothetical protein